MRKIVCQSCDNRFGDNAHWVAFNEVYICESCRLAAVEYLRIVCGLSLAKSHPFLDELSGITKRS